MKYLIAIVCSLLIFCSGVQIGHERALTETHVVMYPYHDNRVVEIHKHRIKTLEDNEKFYLQTVDDLNKYAGQLEDENAILKFKVAWYKVLTGKELEVRVER